MAVALAAYRSALPRWRGEPFTDASFAEWAGADRLRLQNRYVAAALRAGELLLAVNELEEAGEAARRAIRADRWAEPAYRLLAKVHLAAGDAGGAQRVLVACERALDELGIAPSEATGGLLHRVITPTS